MPPVKVLVDSSAGISPELARRWGIGVVPLYLTWDARTYRDGKDLLPPDFYALLERHDKNPKTAAPAPADFVAACREALAAGHRHVLIVTVTPNMSATYNNACLAAREIGGDRVSVLDSGQGAGAQALIAAHAAHVAARGAGLDAVLSAAGDACRNTELFVAVNTLKYLRRSGRITGPQALMGEMIQMKPILTFEDGKLRVVERPRTMRRAARRLLERLSERQHQAAHVLVMYADTVSAAEELAKHARERLPHVPVDTSPVSGVMGGHTGPGLLGIAVRRRNADR